MQLALPTFSFEYFNSTFNGFVRFNEWTNYCVTMDIDGWEVYVNGTRKKSFIDQGDLRFFDSKNFNKVTYNDNV